MARKPTTPSALREQILASRGLRLSGRGVTAEVDTPTGDKTALIVYIEDKFKMPIEKLLWSDSSAKLSVRLKVNERTIHRWREKFPLEQYRTGPNNRKLPVSKSN